MNHYPADTNLIFELASILSQQNDFSEILRIISHKVAKIFNADVASIVMINPSTQETLKTVIEEKKDVSKNQYHLTQTIIIGWVMRNGKIFFSNNLSNDTRFGGDIFEDENIKSAMCVPLKSQGRNIGYLTVLSKSNQNYDKSSITFLEGIANIVAPHISNVQNIQEYFNIPLPEDSIIHKYRQFGLLGKSKSFVELLKGIEAAAKCDVRIVLEGQTGTGKELIARAIHKLSSRSENPFIAIDCGAIPQNLMESELFGHVKGAFTGANRDRTGLLVEANKGTLFLDEVNNLTMEMQSKLLRTIQEGEVRSVGGNRNIKIDVRIISASSLSLTKLIEEEKFRRDLYFRLMVYPIYVPPLCERKNDIPILANYFLSKFAKKQKKRIQYFHRDIEEYLKNREYPGNIRELENFVERLVTLASNNLKVLEIKNLPKSFSNEIPRSTKDIISPQIRSLSSSLKEYEKNIILQSLEDNDWNQNNVAKSLNVLEQTLRAKMKRLGISRRK